MKKTDPNYIAKLEQAIAKQYGKAAVQNPRGNWDDEKERDYLQQLKDLAKKENKIRQQSEKIEIDGVHVSKKTLSRNPIRTCSTCETYSMKPEDDVYMSKFECCKRCYIAWVEDREERWKSGWRPTADN
tara:strand:- start:155 stop:541 length:387 start_codon:yes stop_codon:yes gene_type:complete